MRRGEEASRTVRIDGSTQVRQGEETFTLQTEGQAELELGAAEDDEADWVGDIRDHRQDFTDWHQAATSQMEILSPSNKVGGCHTQTLYISFLILILGGGKEKDEEEECK